jgi:hypothetical protein
MSVEIVLGIVVAATTISVAFIIYLIVEDKKWSNEYRAYKKALDEELEQSANFLAMVGALGEVIKILAVEKRPSYNQNPAD